jgi:3-oxoacyl-[acyl-carrier-protein] synthase I
VTAALEVIAAGARTPLGLNAESTAAAVRAALSNFNEFPFVMASGEPVIASADTQLEPGLEGRERLVPLIESVLDEVMQQLAQGTSYRGTCYLLLALPEARPGFSDHDAQWVADNVGSCLRAVGWQVRNGIVGRGHAGSIAAVQRVVQESSRGAEGLFLIVGADSYHHPDTFTWLERNRRFAQPTIRSGFIPGEGAGCLTLTSRGLREALGVQPLAVLGGVGTAQETLLRDSETGSFGAGMTQAVLGAIEALQLPQDAVDTLYSDINGERYRSEEWGFVAMKTYSLWKSLEYEAPGSSWGDVGAAFGPLAGVLAVQAYKRGYASGPRTIVMAGSDSGLRGAMLLHDATSASNSFMRI